jgi:hypothetical protein
MGYSFKLFVGKMRTLQLRLESLTSKYIYIHISAIGRKKQVIQAGSVYDKLLPKIFVWQDGLDYDKQEANRFVQHISKFLSVVTTKYSRDEFAVMLPDSHMIEHKYTLSFKTIFVDAARMPVGQSGDFHFKINGVQVGAELRMMGVDKTDSGAVYYVEVYKPQHELATIVNSSSCQWPAKSTPRKNSQLCFQIMA